jgi:EAL domain-containing protein (putative c-di-GMP-specific phosphodiesterase class I)
MNARAHELLLLETSLRQALERDQLVLHYQPQYDLNNRQLLGFEALVRWQHPEHGMISPADFIPLAEETGLIVPIGEWVLHTACRQNRAWQKQGLPAVRMAVNISARQFRQPGLAQQVSQILHETGLDARWLELELTESMIMGNAENAIRTMQALNTMGVELAIDDFGSGYSSLAYLKRFPISKLKIDQSFVRDVMIDVNDATIAASVIALAKSMHLEVIAEGIEDHDQLTFLQQKGCHQGQGYLFSPALPADQAEALFKSAARESQSNKRILR